MKKKMAVLAAGVCALAVLVTGCSKEISNDYVKVKQYKGIEVEKADTAKVTDEEVESYIQAQLEQNADVVEVTDRPVESGDTVKIDYEGKVDGVAFDGGSATDSDLEIGSGTFIPGFEDGIIGHNAGETFDIDVTFPEDYGNAEMAGKAAVFTITVKSISKSNVPELNDDFVAKVSKESKTVEDYKKEVKKLLADNNQASAEETLVSNAWSALMENVEVKKYPTEELQEMIDMIDSQYKQYAEMYGVEFTDFLETYLNMDEDTYNTQLSKAAKSQIQQEQVIELIAKKEKLALSEDELQKKYEEYAETYGYESVEAMLEDASEEELKKMANKEVVQKWVADNCKQVEPKESDDSTGNAGNNKTNETSSTK